MNYDEMPAGEELDYIVINEVMGWRDVFHDLNGVHYEDADGEGLSFGPFMPHFQPSANIAHAWEAVEALKEKWSFIVFYDAHYGPADGRWKCLWTDAGVSCDVHYIDDLVYGRVTADTAPLAICRAALKALKGKE